MASAEPIDPPPDADPVDPSDVAKVRAVGRRSDGRGGGRGAGHLWRNADRVDATVAVTGDAALARGHADRVKSSGTPDPDLERVVDVAATSDAGPSELGVDPPEGFAPYSFLLTEENQELQKFAAKFLDKYYWRFNTCRKYLHVMYAPICRVGMTFQKEEWSIEIETKLGIKEFWERSHLAVESQCTFFVAQHTDDKTLILANGFLYGFGSERCNYVQAFLLNEERLIIKDILYVFREGKPILMSKFISPPTSYQRNEDQGKPILMSKFISPPTSYQRNEVEGKPILMPKVTTYQGNKIQGIIENQNAMSSTRHSYGLRNRTTEKSVKTGLGDAALTYSSTRKLDAGKSVKTGLGDAALTYSSTRKLDAGKESGSVTVISEASSILDAGLTKRSGKMPVEKAVSLKFSSEAKSMLCAASQRLIGKQPAAPKSVVILYNDIMLLHKAQYYCDGDIRMIYRKKMWNHEESPERIKCIMDRFLEDNLFERADYIEHDLAAAEDIMAVHRDVYVDFIQRLPISAEEILKYIGFYTNDVFCSKGTRDAIFSAAGANVKACDMVYRGQYKKAFAVVRPPGHHASKEEAEGFCYVNNIAVGASYLLRKHKVERILVVDWDVHHGNGTQDLFYESNQVLFLSTFNKELDYPLSSRQEIDCIGKGNGAGYNINVPLESGYSDSDMLYVWTELLIPILKKFDPQITLISCGFDAAQGDPLGYADVTPPCFATLLDMIDKEGNGKIVLSLEGGYNLSNLAECSSLCARAMVGGDPSALRNENTKLLPLKEGTVETVMTLKRHLSWFWVDAFKKLRSAARK